ncbi:sugar transferase [Shimia ponticola]|uniref:sugar transferase n=1 Tax=Shimia ponticola TaxID=2582893 RepID=UPI0011BF70EA|nr:sugar transferase [Shimia ponticola]
MTPRAHGFGRSWGRQARVPFGQVSRLIDLVAVVVAAPLCLLLACVLCALNPVWNPGPLFFSQVRVGLHGRTFTLWKFRTMTGQRRQAAFEGGETARLTPFGRWLRKTHLDELPQIVNLALGNMALVGPRPEQIEFASDYARALPFYWQRHRVKPGITGLAQWRLGYTETLGGARHKLRWDMNYISRRSLAFDLYLIWKTVVLLTVERANPR